jgi:hypothetical protein
MERATVHRGRHINLQDVIWPRDKPIDTLRRALYCQPCFDAARRKFRPNLIALIDPTPDAEPVRARKPR